MIHRAIKKINPTAEFTVNAEDINQITWLNGTTPISKADIEEQLPIVEQEIADAVQTKIAKKEEAKAKLVELGLTEEHLKALGL